MDRRGVLASVSIALVALFAGCRSQEGLSADAARQLLAKTRDIRRDPQTNFRVTELKLRKMKELLDANLQPDGTVVLTPADSDEFLQDLDDLYRRTEELERALTEIRDDADRELNRAGNP